MENDRKQRLNETVRERNERIEAVLLTRNDTWLSSIVAEDFEITDQWLSQINGFVRTGSNYIEEHVLGTKDALAIREARTLFCTSLMRCAKGELTEPCLELLRLNVLPARFIEAARLFDENSINIPKILRGYAKAFTSGRAVLSTKIKSRQDQYGKERAAIIFEGNPSLLGKSDEALALQHGALSKLNSILNIVSNPEDIVAQHPRLLNDSLGKIFAIARIAVEFDGQLGASQIGMAMAQPLETHLLTVIKDGRHDVGRAKHYRQQTAQIDRRRLILSELTPQICKRLGNKVLLAYFRVAPLTAEEIKRYKKLAESAESAFKEYARPFKDKDGLVTDENLPALMPLLPLDAEINEEWVAKINGLIRLGSRDARSQKIMKDRNPVVVARREVLNMLGWMTEGHPLYGRTQSFLRRQPSGMSPANIVRTAMFLHEEHINAVRFMKESPSFVISDIPNARQNVQEIRALFTAMQTREPQEALINEHCRLIVNTPEHIKQLQVLIPFYSHHLKEWSAADIRCFIDAPIEAHMLAIHRDKATNPRAAYNLMRRSSQQNLRQELASFFTASK